MGFIFGLLIGSAVTSGGQVANMPNIGTIPFRCLAAFEQSDDAYRACRWQSMNNNLYNDGCLKESREAKTGGCSLEQNITWEIAGLRELKQSIEQNRQSK